MQNQKIYNYFNLLELNNILEIPLGPGIYMIICKKNKKIYFGESSNILARLAMHSRGLENQTHDCDTLQADYNLYGQMEFIFAYLYVGSEWVNMKTRVEKQNELIHLNVDYVYNDVKLTNSFPKFKRKVKYHDKLYPSFAAAAKEHGFSETHLKRLVKNPEKSGWVEVLEKNSDYVGSETSRPVIVHNVIYRSVREASIKTGIHRRTLTNHLNSLKERHNYCFYIKKN
uniref:Putative GIY-YIG homing endonuclease n=1 Tax=Jenufa minuta TaxID=993092 RepID=A0A0S2LNM2_JENMI|nr:putative GIY-YIG homing endonuclease [Jenufa minuta]ALO63008.1 putative GIY-YIG homing endonuclease [Jenufa minuta]